MKKYKMRGKNTSYKLWYAILLVVVILSINSIPLINAAEVFSFDNVKQYDEETRTVTVVNTFGLGRDLATIQLKTPLNYKVGLGYQRVAEQIWVNYEDGGKPFDKLELYNLKDNENEIERQVDYKIRITNEHEVNDYVDRKGCTNFRWDINGTTCDGIVSGTHTVERYTWEDIPEELPAGTYIIGMFTDTKEGDYIEWIPTYYGVKIQEWATWSASLTNGLRMAYNFNEQDVSDVGIIIDERVISNGTNQGADNVSGQIGTAYQFVKTNTDCIDLETDDLVNDALTVNVWAKAYKVPTTYSNIVGKGNDFAIGDGSTVWTNIGWGFHDGDWRFVTDSADLVNNTWTMVTATYDGTTMRLYKQGLNVANTSYVGVIPQNNDWAIGCVHGANPNTYNYDGHIDMPYFWNRTLSASEIQTLYNDGNGLELSTVVAPTMTLNSPVDVYNSSSKTINFNGTIGDEGTASSVSLIINNSYNATNTSGIQGNYLWSVDLLDGLYNWTYEGCNEAGCRNATVQTFKIDTIVPKVKTILPTGNQGALYAGKKMFVNYTYVETNPQHCYLNYNATNLTITCGTNTTIAYETGNNDATIWINDTSGNINSSTTSWSFDYVENLVTGNNFTFETVNEYFEINITTDGTTPTANFIFNGTNEGAASVVSLGSNYWNISQSKQIPVGLGNNTWSFDVDVGGNSANSTVNQQLVSLTNFTICKAAPQDIVYLNFTFRDEGDLSAINGTVPTATFYYTLGDSVINKTLSFTNASLNYEYDFCLYPSNRTVDLTYTFQHTSPGYQQRIQSETNSFTNDTTNKTLYLLANTDGLLVTFQVINIAEQAISGVIMNASRMLEGVPTVVAQGITSSAGVVSFFLHPDFAHTLLAFGEGYPQFSTTDFFTTTPYTISLGTGSSAEVFDYDRGITYSKTPSGSIINPNEDYTFTFNLTSDYWEVTELGYTLENEDGVIYSTESLSANGGGVTSIVNTTDNETFVMNAYWIIAGNTTNVTFSWLIYNDTLDDDWSIRNFFTDLTNYTDSGLFGLDSFGLAIILFFTIFIITGMMSWRFGLGSPQAISGILWGLVLFFDVGLNMMNNFTPIAAFNNFPTIIMTIIFVSVVVREGLR